MSEKTQTQFEVGTELVFNGDTEAETSIVDNVRGGLSRFTGEVALQARMATFDVLHGTHYRRIRNELVEQKRRTEFERRIGLVAIDQN
jgi:hypothetical protein